VRRKARPPLPSWVQDKAQRAVPWGRDAALDSRRREYADAARQACAIWRRIGVDPYKGMGERVNG